jgi:hypothetical protein
MRGVASIGGSKATTRVRALGRVEPRSLIADRDDSAGA